MCVFTTARGLLDALWIKATVDVLARGRAKARLQGFFVSHDYNLLSLHSAIRSLPGRGVPGAERRPAPRGPRGRGQGGARGRRAPPPRPGPRRRGRAGGGAARAAVRVAHHWTLDVCLVSAGHGRKRTERTNVKMRDTTPTAPDGTARLHRSTKYEPTGDASASARTEPEEDEHEHAGPTQRQHSGRGAARNSGPASQG